MCAGQEGAGSVLVILGMRVLAALSWGAHGYGEVEWSDVMEGEAWRVDRSELLSWCDWEDAGSSLGCALVNLRDGAVGDWALCWGCQGHWEP